MFAGKESVGRLVIEVKLDSDKSGEAGEEDEEETPDLADADQLRKYWQGLRVSTGGGRSAWYT